MWTLSPVMQGALKPLVLTILTALTLLSASCASGPGGDRGIVSTTDARQIESKARAALDRLYRNNPAALSLAQSAQGVLVFPEMLKGGLVLGGSLGDGALYQRNSPTSYYRSISASYGLQAGLQKYGYALFLMDDEALQSLNESGGWELGSSPNLVLVDKGVSASLSTTTVNKGTYAFGFDHKGLMAGIGLQGTKITRLNIEP
jgi:lipid-binding SYLF domain-containing protein